MELIESGKKVIEHLEQMPSAQADSKELSYTHKALDTISRQVAIDALNEYFARIGKLKRRGLTKGEKAISLDTVGIIKTLPSAQPERFMAFASAPDKDNANEGR